MDDMRIYRLCNNSGAGSQRNNGTACVRHKAIKVSTALRALRRIAIMLYFIILLNSVLSTFSVGFAVWAFVATTAMWGCWRWIIIISSKNGKIDLNKIF